MDTHSQSERASHAPVMPGPAVRARRRQGGRWEIIRANARRRRLIANFLVLGTTGAVVALAALFNHVLSH